MYRVHARAPSEPAARLSTGNGAKIRGMDTMSLGAQALADMRRRDDEAGIDPRTPSRVTPLGPRPEPAQPFRPPSPDWHEEALERQRADLAARAQLVDVLAPEDTEATPAKPKSRTPRLDAARAILEDLPRRAAEPEPARPPRPRLPAPDWNREP